MNVGYSCLYPPKVCKATNNYYVKMEERIANSVFVFLWFIVTAESFSSSSGSLTGPFSFASTSSGCDPLIYGCITVCLVILIHDLVREEKTFEPTPGDSLSSLGPGLELMM